MIILIVGMLIVPSYAQNVSQISVKMYPNSHSKSSSASQKPEFSVSYCAVWNTEYGKSGIGGSVTCKKGAGTLYQAKSKGWVEFRINRGSVPAVVTACLHIDNANVWPKCWPVITWGSRGTFSVDVYDVTFPTTGSKTARFTLEGGGSIFTQYLKFNVIP